MEEQALLTALKTVHRGVGDANRRASVGRHVE